MPTTPFYLQQFRFLDGSPASGGKLYATVQGTETPAVIYLNPTLTTPTPQPLVLSADGTVPQFWAPTIPGLRFKLYDPRNGVDTLVWTRDYISDGDGVNAPGTVTSVGLTLGAAMDALANVSNSPVVTSGNIGLELADQPSGKALMSPVSGTGKPSFRQIGQSDIFAGMESTVITLNAILANGDAPPPTPATGFYALAYGMSGALLGHDNELAYWDGTAWSFSVPSAGQKAYLPSNSGIYKAGFKRYTFPQWVTVAQNEIYSEDIRGTSVMVGGLGGEVTFSPFSHPNAAAAVTGILVFDRANIETTGIAFKTAGTNKYASISGSDTNEREVNLRGFSTGAPLDEGVWTSLRLLDIKAVNGVFTGASPVERINALGAGFLTSLSISGLTNGKIPLVSTAGGLLGNSSLSEDATSVKCAKALGVHGVTPPTSRPTISGQRTATATLAALYQALGATGLILDATTGSSVTREAIIQPLPITNSAPGTVTVVSGGMKSFGFDGGASTEELFYHCDVQHDYIAGSDMIFHVHWMPATATGGNVKWQIEYQWVEAGATWPAPTLLSAVTAAGTTAWADKMSSITLPGAGHTYNSRIMVRLFRVPTDAADTYAGDAVLSSVGMHYQADPGQP